MTQSISLSSWSTAAKIKLPIPVKKVALDKLSNYDLILRLQDGRNPNRAAFAELVKRYQSHVDRVLYHLAPDWQDRGDLAQEVWIRVYKSIGRLKEPSKFRGWLSKITSNLFYDELRKRKKATNQAISLDAPKVINNNEINWELPSNDPSPDDKLNTAEFYEKLRLALADLPENFRTVIVLREIQGMSYDEIAGITGASLGTVKSRISRARAKLQSVLSKYLHD